MKPKTTSKPPTPPALSSLPSTSSNQPTTKKNPPPPPPDLAPLSSPSPSPDKNDRFKGIALPNGWLDCPLTFHQPLRDYRILVCKTPIDEEIAQYLAIPKKKQFAPHAIYTLPNKHYIAKQKQINADSAKLKKRKIGLVVDLTNQKYFDQISFNNGKKTNKVKLRVIAMENLSKPTDEECLEFCYLVKAFLDGTNNADSYIVVYDDLGFNLCGFMLCCFMVNELNYSVDAAVYTFAQGTKPGIFNEDYVRLLHEKYSDEEDQKIFEQRVKLKPLQRPIWLQQQKKDNFAVPTTSIRRKRTFSQISTSLSQRSKPAQFVKKSEQKTSDFSINSPPNFSNSSSSTSILTEPQILQSPKMESMPSQSQSSSNIIEEPTLIGMSQPPPMKKQRICVNDEREQMLKKDHSYLVSVRNEHLQHLTSIILQLSKSKDLFHSICQKSVTVPKISLLSLSKNYRISWLGKGWNLWMMILGKKGCFFVDPYYFEHGKEGGIYHVKGTMFMDTKTNNAMDGTLCCGELVVDVFKDKKVPRFLITDLLVLDKQSLSKFPHTERLNMAENKLYKKCAKSLQKSKLRIRVKPMYPIENEEILKKLEKMMKYELPHKNDGFGLFPIKPPFGQRILRMAL